MTHYNSKSDLAMAYALQNIKEGVENDLVSEVAFVSNVVIVTMAAANASRYGINGKCVIIKNFGYATI